MVRYILTLPVLLLIAAAPPTQRFKIVSADSAVSAKVAFFGLASKTARFPKVRGEATLREGDPASLSLEVMLDATALEAPDRVTLARLRGQKFFWVEKYPAVIFRGTGIAMRDDRAGSVAGNLTARGVTRPVTLEVTFDTPPAQAAIGDAIGITATTTIDRRDFGMKSYPLIVGKKVDIRIRTRLRPD
jgi:polyisoprenoid-binding protein YceI